MNSGLSGWAAQVGRLLERVPVASQDELVGWMATVTSILAPAA